MVYYENNVFGALEQFRYVSYKALGLVLLMGILCIACGVILRRVRGKKTKKRDILIAIVYLVYVSVIAQFTLFCRKSGTRGTIKLNVLHGLFVEGVAQPLAFLYAILNCILFIPYGYIIAMFEFIKKCSMKKQIVSMLFFSMLSSLCIETIQIITKRGYFETQDLLFNTIGGMLGWFVYYFCVSNRHNK